MKEETKLHVEENEKHLLLDHSYDGLQELNHPLPFWWQFTFWAGIIFGVLYIIYYIFMGGPSLRDEFNKDYAVIASKLKEYKQKESQFDPVVYAQYSTPEQIKNGKNVFNTNCIPCHLEGGSGDIGPNLTDEYWLNSRGTPETNYPVVFNGVPVNGMPTWSEVLSKEEIYQVVAYVQTLHNTHHPKGKEPQGNKINE